MTKRADAIANRPRPCQAMAALELYLKKAALSSSHPKLIIFRASPIKGFVYYISIHRSDAPKAVLAQKTLND